MNVDTIFKFRTKSIRTVNSPSDDSIITYFVYVNMRDIPDDISLEINPRKPKMSTAIAKSIISAVVSSDNLNFDINNRGIVLAAKAVKFDTSSNTVSVNMGDDISRYGILDGGHTYTAIIQNRDRIPSGIDKFVKMEIIVGDNLDVAALSDARNTSAQVSDIALFELDDKFDFIKEAVQNEPYGDKIAFKDNDNKPIPISDFLRLMFAFNIKRFPNDTVMPISSYSGKAAVFTDYSKEFGTGKYPEANDIYLLLAPHISKLVNLYEKIIVDMPDLYDKYKKNDGKNGKFGALRGITAQGNYKSDFTGRKIKHQIASGFILPIFGAFRALLRYSKDEKSLKWQFEPEEVWKEAGLKLVQNTFDTETNPQMAGKSKTLWQANYRIVDSVRKDFLIAQLEEA